MSATSPVTKDVTEDGELDQPSLKYYAQEVKKRLDQEKESAEENSFLRSSLRRSDRLKAIENYRRIIKNAEAEKRPELNEAFEGDEGWAYSRAGTDFCFSRAESSFCLSCVSNYAPYLALVDG
ncbi:unnamed protein product [Echinostoma caproni]|uniref:DUF4187 domain-containing protein n=1 Tax=Echinostoma caproni TaxID=27848 RepID=A0A183BFS1_9TREM|nr:unnamed protein product [Echinostoma caproni]